MLFGFLLRNSQGHELKPNSIRTHRTFNLLLWNIHSHIRCNSNWIFGRNMLKHRSMECQQSRARQTPAFAWIRRLDGFRMRTINGFDQNLSSFLSFKLQSLGIPHVWIQPKENIGKSFPLKTSCLILFQIAKNDPTSAVLLEMGVFFWVVKGS